MHLFDAGVSPPVGGTPVYVVAKVGVLADEDADVGHGAEVHVLADLVLDETLVDKRVENPLGDSCKEKI